MHHPRGCCWHFSNVSTERDDSVPTKDYVDSLTENPKLSGVRKRTSKICAMAYK
jgi:hypothetical protein